MNYHVNEIERRSSNNTSNARKEESIIISMDLERTEIKNSSLEALEDPKIKMIRSMIPS